MITRTMRITVGTIALLLVAGVLLTMWTRPRLCTSLLGSPAEISATPRGDLRTEQLAIRLSNAVTADQQTYDRLVTDLTAIRNRVPAIRHVSYQPSDDGKTLIVRLSFVGRILHALRIYRAWDCLNAHYQLQSIDSRSIHGSVLLHFKGIYDMRRLAQLYATLPGSNFAEPNALAITGTKRRVCVTPQDDTWHYVIYESNGSGRLHYITSTPGGNVINVDDWDIPESAEAFEASRPSWVAQYWNAAGCA